MLFSDAESSQAGMSRHTLRSICHMTRHPFQEVEIGLLNMGSRTIMSRYSVIVEVDQRLPTVLDA